MNKQAKLASVVVISLGFYLLITSSFYPLDFLPVYDAKRVLQLILFAVILVFVSAWTPLRELSIQQLSRPSILFRSSLLLFLLIGIVSSLQHQNTAYALLDVSMIFVLVILIVATASSREISGDLFDRCAVLLLATMGFAVAFQEIMGYIASWIVGSEFNYNLALMHFAHPRFYNQLQTWSIPVLTALPLLFPHKRGVRFVCIALIGMQWFIVISNAARGTAVSLLVAMVFIAFWLPEHRKYWVKFQVGGLLTAGIIYFGVLSLSGLANEQSKSGEFYAHSVGRPMMHTSGRSTLWRFSVEDAVKSPILGAGPSRYACKGTIRLPAHPHSFPFRILGEWGMLAFLLFLITAMFIGIRFLENLKIRDKTHQTDPPLRSMLAISLIAGIIHSCVSGLLIMPASQVAMVLIAGWSLSIGQKPNGQKQESSIAGLMLASGAILSLAILVFALTEMSHIDEDNDLEGRLAPRFWQDGKVCD